MCLEVQLAVTGPRPVKDEGHTLDGSFAGKASQLL